MKKSIFVLALITSVMAVACGKETCSADGCKNEATVNGMCDAHNQLAKQDEEIPDPITIDDVTYTYADFDTYNSPAEENGHGGEQKFIVGKLSDLKAINDLVYYEFYTENNGTWIVNFHYFDNLRQTTLKKFEDSDEIVLCGEYQGFSEKQQKPCIYTKAIYVGDKLYKMETWLKGAWREPGLNTSKDLEEISYLEPDNWDKKEGTSQKGMYYYPYDEAVWGMVYVSCTEVSPSVSSDSSATYAYFSEFVSGNNPESEEATQIDGRPAYKSLCYIPVDDGNSQVLQYLVMGDKYLYSFMFGDFYELTPEMQAFAERFMENVKVNVSGKPEKIENDPDFDYEEFNKEVEKQLNEKKETSTTKSTGYQAILDRYSEKLKAAAPKLAQEYKTEAAGISDIEKKAEICNDKVGDLAEISNDGISEMAEYMFNTNGSYDEYSKWADKLMDVYSDEADQIMNAYMNSAL